MPEVRGIAFRGADSLISQTLPTLFSETESLIKPGAHLQWPTSSREPPFHAFPELELQVHRCDQLFTWVVRDPNTGPPACPASV